MGDKTKDNKQNINRPPLPERPKPSITHETFNNQKNASKTGKNL